MTTAFLEPDLIRDEGEELVAYMDTRGNVTWGIGHKDNTVALGTVFTQADVDAQFFLDLHNAVSQASNTFDFYAGLSDLRQDCIINMTFNLGIETLSGFASFLGLMRSGLYGAASLDLKHTAWANEVGARAVRVRAQILTDVHQD